MTRRPTDRRPELEPQFVEKTYREALDLTIAVAGYLEGLQAPGEWPDDRPNTEQQVVQAREGMRLSCCLMQAISWLMIRKGVIRGEISAGEAAAPAHRLGSRETCLGTADAALLPEQFRCYLEQAQGLYRQVARMEAGLLDGPEQLRNPVHDLFDRLRRPD